MKRTMLFGLIAALLFGGCFDGNNGALSVSPLASAPRVSRVEDELVAEQGDRIAGDEEFRRQSADALDALRAEGSVENVKIRDHFDTALVKVRDDYALAIDKLRNGLDPTALIAEARLQAIAAAKAETAQAEARSASLVAQARSKAAADLKAAEDRGSGQSGRLGATVTKGKAEDVAAWTLLELLGIGGGPATVVGTGVVLASRRRRRLEAEAAKKAEASTA